VGFESTHLLQVWREFPEINNDFSNFPAFGGRGGFFAEKGDFFDLF
jgi:hypothetical protein